MKSYLPKDVVVVRNFRKLSLCWFSAGFKCLALYHDIPDSGPVVLADNLIPTLAASSALLVRGRESGVAL